MELMIIPRLELLLQRKLLCTSRRDCLEFGYLFAGLLSSLWLSLATVLLYGLSKTIYTQSFPLRDEKPFTYDVDSG